MHLRRVHIRNVRSIAELIWELPADVDGAGWHVILGDNGSGKSSFLRSIALALIGTAEAAALRQAWDEWIRIGTDEATIELAISSSHANGAPGDGRAARSSSPTTLILRRGRGTVQTPLPPGIREHIAGSDAVHGPFSASYGPFRRFTGGDQELEKLYASQPRLARHLSVFDEAVGLTEALSWLQSLKFKQLEHDKEGDLLGPIFSFVNQPGFLPHGVRLQEVTSRGVDFVDASGFRVSVQQMSDGYRSLLSMTFELVRQMALTYGAPGLFSRDNTQILRPGIVMIDEIDAHLHPSWQRVIGIWLCQHFPLVQFIVSTHSPLICQAAETGTIFRLPEPGADPFISRGEMVGGLSRKRLLYGNVLDAYGTGVFGEGVTRSESGQEKLERLAELNMRELTGSLSDDEKRAQSELREMLPTEASVIHPDDPAP
ncbi:MAG TPA: AAA family ATPase [Kofleriaceae bacterium]|nr:AAA family ATPase [Kofleriaceae bacterium]